MRPVPSIRKYCLWCMDGQRKEIELCPTKDCPFYPMRFGKRPKGSRPVKAIRLKCLDCSIGNKKIVRNCLIKDCSLYPYRFGKSGKKATGRPFIKRK